MPTVHELLKGLVDKHGVVATVDIRVSDFSGTASDVIVRGFTIGLKCEAFWTEHRGATADPAWTLEAGTYQFGEDKMSVVFNVRACAVLSPELVRRVSKFVHAYLLQNSKDVRPCGGNPLVNRDPAQAADIMNEVDPTLVRDLHALKPNK